MTWIMWMNRCCKGDDKERGFAVEYYNTHWFTSTAFCTLIAYYISGPQYILKVQYPTSSFMHNLVVCKHSRQLLMVSDKQVKSK